MSAALPLGEVAERVERMVIGADFGADGYTTRTQADELARHPDLRPGVRLLEVGSGRGWPGPPLRPRDVRRGRARRRAVLTAGQALRAESRPPRTAPRGRVAFYSIFVAPGLSRHDRRRGALAGPPAVATSGNYPGLLRSARFVDVVEVDVTTAYLDTARA